MKEIVFFLEELSAKAMLEGVVPRIILENGISTRYVVFEGKQDLDGQLERRLRGYRHPNPRFIVLRDQDGNPDCIDVKRRINEICQRSGRDNIKIRIACRELESFYFGDLIAVERALNLVGLHRRSNSARFRTPDQIVSPSSALVHLTSGGYQKVSGSRLIGPHMNLDNERSRSFAALVSAIRYFVEN